MTGREYGSSMSDLAPRQGGRLSRRTREQRAYRLVLAGGAAGTLAVVGIVLAALDIIGFGLPLLAAIVAVVCVVLFRRSVS